MSSIVFPIIVLGLCHVHKKALNNCAAVFYRKLLKSLILQAFGVINVLPKNSKGGTKMRINYNVSGEKRKSLVGAVSQELNAPAKYLGAPTFAYEVGGYSVDKSGMLTGADNHYLVADVQGLHDFKAVSEEYDTPLPETEPVPENVRIPYEAELGGRVSPYKDYEEPPAYGTPELAETNVLTVEMPRSAFSELALENLKCLLESKSTLIKKALDIETLALEITEEKVRFPWFNPQGDAAAVRAYTHFVSSLCEMAKAQQRVNATEKPVDNEKYAFRCFLLRLGFIGSEYKGERKILLSKLNGSLAFKNPTLGGANDE